jgi:integrase
MSRPRRPGRRAKNEGTVRYRKWDRRWEGRIRVGWKVVDGLRKPNIKYVTGSNQEEVSARLAELRTQLLAGAVVPTGRNTVEEFLMSWLAGVKATVRPRTWESYELYMRLHAIPVIGHIGLAALRPDHIRKLLQIKQSAGMSPRSAIHLRTILNTAFKQAINDRLLQWNPVSAVKRPKAVRYKYVALNEEQALAFLKGAESSGLRAFFVLALATGARRGEVMGVRWRDINLEMRTLKIEQTIQRMRAKVTGAAGFVTAEPKTPQSRRELEIPEMVIPLLRTHRAKQAVERLAAGSEWNDLDLVFTNASGNPLEPSVIRDEYLRVLEVAGLSHMRFHDLRHSALSFMLAAGVSLRTVMEVAGHSTITMTANTYGHVQRAALADAAQRMNKVLGGEKA